MSNTRKFPRWLKWLSIVLILLVIGITILYFVMSESMPTGKQGPEAEALAAKMLTAIDKSGWDTTAIVQWDFAGRNSYLWDRERHLTQVNMGEDEKVLLDINSKTGKAWQGGAEVTGEAADKLVEKAWANWCNDSFWLNAPAKIMDGGTSRSIVKMDDGSDALLVTYNAGGVTPGDSYLWLLDDNGLPTSYKMWVKIIPVGGMEFTWEDWLTLPTGARIAQLHKGPADLIISDVKGAASLEAFGLTQDPFTEIVQ